MDAGAVPELPVNLSALLDDAVRRRLTESAALLVARRGKVIFRGAAGGASPGSIFDLASVSKVVATTTAVMRLVDQGRVALDARIDRYLPWLAGTDKGAITVEQLLLHTGGLPSVVYRGAPTDGRARIIERIRRARLRDPPGRKYGYSDVGFILLGEIVATVAKVPLARFVADEITGPLGMCSSGYAPPAKLLSRVISPWPGGEKPGQVYDPLAARLGGVAGHAGLFSTLDDLALFGQAMLAGGALRGARVLSRRAVARVLVRRAVPGGAQRGLGWSVDREGGAFGHGGFTGTALWIDPADELVIVLLSNRTFYEPARSVQPLIRRVRALVRSSLLRRPQRPVQTGLDRLVADRFAPLRGKRVGLIVNRTAVDRRGRFIVDLLADAPGVELAALFVPEHGLGARVDRRVADRALVTKRGARVPVYSLFGPRRRPTDDTLRGVDVLVFDIAAVGVRYYTYLATMGWAMEEAARRGIPFIVLDRPNPIGGVRVEGPVSAAAPQTSTNYHPLPVRYGMTVGELARLYNAERRIGVKLKVVRIVGWARRRAFDEQGLPWVDPSPNIRSWRQALLYGATGLLEGTNLAVGRGTDSPFEWIGAPWIDGPRLARELNTAGLPGVFFVADERTPRSSRYRGERCRGVRALLLEPLRFRPVRTGVALALALAKLYPRRWQPRRLQRLLRHDAAAAALRAGKPSQRVVALWARGLRRFSRVRRRYLLYR